MRSPACNQRLRTSGIWLSVIALGALSGCEFAGLAVETGAARGAVALEGEAALASRAAAGELGLLGKGAVTEAELLARARAAGLTDSAPAIRLTARGLTIGRIQNIDALIRGAAARTVAGFGMASPFLEEVAIIRGASRVLSYPVDYPVARSRDFKVTSPEGVPLSVLRRVGTELVIRNRSGAVVAESIIDEYSGSIRHFTDSTHGTLRGMTFRSGEKLRHWLIDIDGNPVYIGSETFTIPTSPPPDAITLTIALTAVLEPEISPTPTPSGRFEDDWYLKSFDEGLKDLEEMMAYNSECGAVKEEVYRLSQAIIPHYRARLSEPDHFTTVRMGEKVPLTTVKDILIQDRINQRGILQPVLEPEDEGDLFFQPRMTRHPEVFDRPIHVTPAGGERTIIDGTPLVAVEVHPDLIEVKILEENMKGPKR